MSTEPIQQQLNELAQFKTLIANALKNAGQPIPETGFKEWYKAVTDAILASSGYSPIDSVTCAPPPKCQASENNIYQNYSDTIIETVSATISQAS